MVDSRNHRVQVYTTDGKYVSGWGSHGSGPDQLDTPWGIHIDAHGDVYVADWKNGRVQKRDRNGELIMQFGQPVDGPCDLNHPTSVAVDTDDDVYVADWGNHKLRIYRPDGDLITSLIGDAQWLSKWGQQSIDANPDMAKMRRRVKSLEPEWRFYYPTAVAFRRGARFDHRGGLPTRPPADLQEGQELRCPAGEPVGYDTVVGIAGKRCSRLRRVASSAASACPFVPPITSPAVKRRRPAAALT